MCTSVFFYSYLKETKKINNQFLNVNVALVDYLCQRFYDLNMLYGTCVTHKNSDLLMKFRKED